MAKLYKHNIKGSYGTFYETKYPHIIELALKNNDSYNREWSVIELYVNSKKYDANSDEFYNNEFGFFNKVIFYNSKQCSGELDIEIKNIKEDDFFDQVDNPFETNANKVGGIWYITDFRDNVVIYDKPFFNKNWDNIYSSFPIDKIINNQNYGTEEEPQYVIDFNKDWQELSTFKDKYILIRLIDYSEDDSKQLITKYSTDQTIQYETL